MNVAIEQDFNYRRIEDALHYLENNFQRQPELDEVAEKVHVSPFHFQRIFSEWAGISPKRFLQFLTVTFLKTKLLESRNLSEAAALAGLSSQSRVYDLFTTIEAVTPQEYKQQGKGLQIDYGIHETLFGSCLIGITGRGVCWLSFIGTDEEPKNAIQEMKSHWYHSVFFENPTLTETWAKKIFSRSDTDSEKPGSGGLNIFLKGTNFQIKVWQALLKIPMGSVTTYQEIAREIKNPNALQAVGSAVGSNHVAYLIPCHRVIRKDGVLGEYRWDATRKKSMVGWEMAKASKP